MTRMAPTRRRWACIVIVVLGLWKLWAGPTGLPTDSISSGKTCGPLAHGRQWQRGKNPSEAREQQGALPVAAPQENAIATIALAATLLVGTTTTSVDATQLPMPDAACPDCRIGEAPPGQAFARGGQSAAVTAERKVQNLISQNRVMVFSKTTCPFCAKAKAALAAESVDFQVLELDQLPPAEALAIQRVLGDITGASTVPRVFVYGTCIGGGDETVMLQNSGDLRKMLDTGALPRNEKLKVL
mmetsp:Transcript_29371/g.62499  ORF Transcript_29371/g.62499 Transcript_29371/m.62499 type:complete len:243 (+) Transcript_29371:57-785(+)